MQSNWATEFSSFDEICCDMSAPKPDTRCAEDNPGMGMTCWEAWENLVYAIVERYDGDGINEPSWVNRSLIKLLTIGNEQDSYGHWEIYNGTPEKYEQILKIAKSSAKNANQNIIFSRGKSNFGNHFDNNSLTANWSVFEHTNASLTLYNNSFEIFALQYNDYYTGLYGMVDSIKEKMNEYGYETPFYISDANAGLFIRKNPLRNLPPFYEDLNMNDIPDVIDDMVNLDENSLQYNQSKSLYLADQAKLVAKKITVALYKKQQFLSFQPFYDGLFWNSYHWWYAGFVDGEKYIDNGMDINGTLKPNFYTFSLLVERTVGADREVRRLNLGEYIHVYQFNKSGEEFYIAWYENLTDTDANGLIKRNQSKIINLSSYIQTNNVNISHIVTELDGAKNPIYPEDKIISTSIIKLSEEPIFIYETNALINETCIPSWQCTEWGDCIDGNQTRSCVDINSCGIDDGKPSESQVCFIHPADYDGDGFVNKTEILRYEREWKQNLVSIENFMDAIRVWRSD